MKKIVLLLLCSFLLKSSVAHAEEYYSGCGHNYGQDLYLGEQILRQGPTKFKAMAEKGQPTFQLLYARCLRDREKAKIWTWKAAKQGEGAAWWDLAKMEPKHYEEYIEKAAYNHYIPAFNEVFSRNLFLAGKHPNLQKAKEFADFARQKQWALDPYPENADFFHTSDILDAVDQCVAAGVPHIPEKDLPTKEDKALYESPEIDCALFDNRHLTADFRFFVEPDREKYRRCLLSKRSVDNNRVAEIYANGWGVDKNILLAKALICHGNYYEPVEMLHRLYKFKLSLDIDYDFSNGLKEETISNNRQRRQQRATEAYFIKNYLKQLKPDQETVFLKLIESKNAYLAEKIALNEFVQQEGNSTSTAVDLARSFNFDFWGDINKFEKGYFPKDDFKNTQAKLDKIYKRLTQMIDHPDFDSADFYRHFYNMEDLEAEQREWLRYREVYADFLALRYPDFSKERWFDWITQTRARELDDIGKP